MEKPSKLEFALAISPIPVIGEKSAQKVASYIAGDTEIPTRSGETTQFSELLTFSRLVGYSSLAPIIGAINYFS